jgi:hypothetical protein
MCEFVSWIEKDSKVYFLTGRQVYQTKRGKELQKHSGNIEDDKLGHGAIRFYYHIEGGQDKEYTDFTKPNNLPSKIVTAIKLGRMRGMAYGVSGLLTATADKAWQEATAPADKAYQEATAPADKAWQEAKNTADKAYQEATAPAYKAWQEATAPAYKAWQEAKNTAYKAWQEATAPAYKAWQEATATADKAWQEATATAFWDLFADVNNRTEVWR